MLTSQRYLELVHFILTESQKSHSQKAIDRSTRRLAAAFPDLALSELKRACTEAKSRFVAELKQEFVELKVDFPADLERLLLVDDISLEKH